MHTHGALYNKTSEGTPYADGSNPAINLAAAVPPNTTVTYTWKLPQRSAPGPAEGSSKLWMYHSHTSEVGDTYAGLVGGMVVVNQGMGDAFGKPKDVDRCVYCVCFGVYFGVFYTVYVRCTIPFIPRMPYHVYAHTHLHLHNNREYVLLFMVGNEQKSSLFNSNMVQLFGKDGAANATMQLEDDAEFQESNLMHSINGMCVLVCVLVCVCVCVGVC